MTRTSPPQVAFSSGLLDPLLHRRFDYQRFQTGLAECRGFLPLVQGGVTRAPGTIYRGQAKGACVLIPFVFAEDDAVVLEFSANAMRVWRYGAPIMAGSVPYEIVTPYGAASLARLRWVQSADVIYMCDGLQPVQRLSRFALDNWTIAPQVFDSGPFRIQNLDKAKTIQASGNTGSITLTANAAFWAANHVGSLIQLQPTDNTAVPLWVGNAAIAVGDKRRYDGNIYQLAAGTNTGPNPPIHSDGTEEVQSGVRWTFLGDGTGVARITAITSTTVAQATVLRRIPEACVASATYRWTEGAWSDRYGYPAEVDIYDQRLVFAANPSEPRSVWFSGVGDFADFLPGVEADSSFAYTISGEGSINRIINMKRGRNGLHIFALGEEHSTRSDSRAQVIGPTTAVFSIDSSIGSSQARPIAPDGDPIFISRDRRRVFQISYQLDRDGNQAKNLTRVAQHLGNGLFEQIVWQGAPEPVAWLRLASGGLVAMIYDASEDVLGWAELPVAGGTVESMAVTPSADGTADTLTLVVRRTVNGVLRRFIEEQAVTWGQLTGASDVTSAVHFFAAASFAPALPASVFAVPHLAGAEVHVWTDQGTFGPLTVEAGGNVTLPAAVLKACVGLFDDSHFFETLDIQAQTSNGSAMGRNKKLTDKTGLCLHRTAQGYVQVVERAFPNSPVFLPKRALVPAAAGRAFAAALSGVVQIETPSGNAKEISLRFSPYGGAPMTITGVIPNIEEAGS